MVTRPDRGRQSLRRRGSALARKEADREKKWGASSRKNKVRMRVVAGFQIQPSGLIAGG